MACEWRTAALPLQHYSAASCSNAPKYVEEAEAEAVGCCVRTAAVVRPSARPARRNGVDLTDDGACVMRARVMAADAAAIAPPLRAHYAPGADGALTFAPGVRAFAGTHPLARGLVCLWKGRVRYNSCNERGR